MLEPAAVLESDDVSNSSAAKESSEDGRMKGDTDSGEESSETRICAAEMAV